MTRDTDNSRLRLEGLVLSDEFGTLYEVPCVVIERYRLLETPPGAEDSAAGANASHTAVGVHQPAPWMVRGGVYVAAASTPPLRL